jgi:predicted amidohydrolase
MLTEAETPPLDLLLTGGTVVDPSQGLHAKKDVGMAQGRIVLVEDAVQKARARQIVDCADLIVTPGLVDLHVHVYEGASHYGIEVDSTCLQTGATTVLDLGSAGAWTFSGFRRQVIDNALSARVVRANRDVVLGIKLRMSRALVGTISRARLSSSWAAWRSRR